MRLTPSRFRWLREHRLGWLVPFYMKQEGYSAGARTAIVLWIWRFGRSHWEVWLLRPEFGMDWIDNLRDKGATQSEIYDRIKLSGELLQHTDEWEIARGYC